MNNLIIGTQYNCWKKKRKKRQDVIDKMHVGDRVYFEKTEYNGDPLVLVIDDKTKLDIGVMSPGVSETIIKDYPNSDFEGCLTDRYKQSFHVQYWEVEESHVNRKDKKR